MSNLTNHALASQSHAPPHHNMLSLDRPPIIPTGVLDDLNESIH